MVTGTSDQGQWAQVKGFPHSVIFMLGLLIFSNTTLIFFHYYFKVNTICDKYTRYWNNGMCLSNQINGNTRVRAKKAPGTRIRVKLG